MFYIYLLLENMLLKILQESMIIWYWFILKYLTIYTTHSLPRASGMIGFLNLVYPHHNVKSGQGWITYTIIVVVEVYVVVVGGGGGGGGSGSGGRNSSGSCWYSSRSSRCCSHIGPLTPYTPLISPISVILTYFPIRPQYLLTPVNIYDFLLPPLIYTHPHYPLLIPMAPLISTNSYNPHPISIIWT